MDLFNNLGTDEPQDWALGCFADEPKHMPKNAPRGFSSFSMMALWLAAATSRAPSTMQAGRLPRAVPGTGCFDPAPGYARCEFSSDQFWIHQATSREALFSFQQLPALQREYQPGTKPDRCCTETSLSWPCCTLKPVGSWVLAQKF